MSKEKAGPKGDKKKSEKIDKQNHHLAFSWMEDSFGKEFLG